MTYELSHPDALESEAIHLVRDVAAEFERPGRFLSPLVHGSFILIDESTNNTVAAGMVLDREI